MSAFIDEHIYLPVGDTKLYIRVRGNTTKDAVLYLHGGPGGSSAAFLYHIGQYLEGELLMIYLDQRGSGLSDKYTDVLQLNVTQYVYDLNEVIRYVCKRYHKKGVNLLGSSWGSTLGFAYLIKYQKYVRAFVCTGPVADMLYPFVELINHEKKLVDCALLNEKTKAKTATLLRSKKYLENIDLTKDDFRQIVKYTKWVIPEQLNFNVYYCNSPKPLNRKQKEEFNQLTFLNDKKIKQADKKMGIINRAFRNDYHYNHLNLLPQLKRIKKPVFIIQGEFDYCVGLGQGQKIYDALTSLNKSEKKLNLIPNVAHSIAMENPKLLINLIKKYLKP